MADHDSLGEFEHLVLLAILRVGTGAYGIPVREEIETQAGRAVSLGALYSTLRRLEAKKLISSETVESVETGRPRKILSVTPEGLRAVQVAQMRLRSMTEGLEALFIDL